MQGTSVFPQSARYHKMCGQAVVVLEIPRGNIGVFVSVDCSHFTFFPTPHVCIFVVF